MDIWFCTVGDCTSHIVIQASISRSSVGCLCDLSDVSPVVATAGAGRPQEEGSVGAGEPWQG